MLDRIVEVFCEVDDFCQAFVPQWEASLLGPGRAVQFCPINGRDRAKRVLTWVEAA
jgi:hypothetical protein